MLWRLTFETLCGLRELGFKGRSRFYFAYGANLDPEVMKHRGMRILSALPSKLPGYRLRFTHPIPFRGVGMASVEADAQSCVHGIVYTIPQIDEWIMDCCESRLFLKRHRKLHASVGGAVCFFYQTTRPTEGLLPSTLYLQKLTNGYKKMFDPGSPYLEALQNHPSHPTMVPTSPPDFLIRDYEKWGKVFKPILEIYDRLCMKVFISLIFRRSVVSWILHR